MSKSHKILIKETKRYKRKLHILPTVLGITGCVMASFAAAASTFNRQELIILLAALGIAVSSACSIFPIICGIVLLMLSFFFASFYIWSLSGLGLISALLMFHAGILSIKIRKDLLSKWGW